VMDAPGSSSTQTCSRARSLPKRARTFINRYFAERLALST
jgi:hypothetical protein